MSKTREPFFILVLSRTLKIALNIIIKNLFIYQISEKKKINDQDFNMLVKFLIHV